MPTEIRKAFKPFFAGAGDDEKTKADETIVQRTTWFAEMIGGEYFFGDGVSVADCYPFVISNPLPRWRSARRSRQFPSASTVNTTGLPRDVGSQPANSAARTQREIVASSS